MHSIRMQGIRIVVALAALVPGLAGARVEEIRWQQGDTTNVAGFQIHWGLASRSYSSTVDVGMHAPDPDGIYRFDITVPDTADVYVAMTAYSAEDLQSELSNERLRAAPAVPEPDPPAPDPEPEPDPPAPDPEPEPDPPGAPDPDPPASVGVPYRLNAGGPALSLGSETWSADTFATGGVGRGTISGVTAAEDGPVYQTFRYGDRDSSGFGYEIPLAPGRYRVVLHFAEGYSGAASVGGRVFDVALEGATLLGGLDVFAAAGFSTAETRSFDVDVVDGALSIFLTRITATGPLVSGIEILDAASAPPPGGGAPPGAPLLLSPQ